MAVCFVSGISRWKGKETLLGSWRASHLLFLFLLLHGFQLADSGGLIKLLETSRVRGADVRNGVGIHVHRDRDVATPFGRVGSSKGRDVCCCSRRVAGGESETAGVVGRGDCCDFPLICRPAMLRSHFDRYQTGDHRFSLVCIGYTCRCESALFSATTLRFHGNAVLLAGMSSCQRSM